MTAQNKFAAEDGTELMYYSYQLLTLSVANLEELRSGEAAEAERNVENFNSKMTALLEKAMEVGRVMQEDAAQLYKESGTAGLPFYDETSASCCRTGDLLSVRVSGCSYAGGAHPSRCDSGYLFDLRSGQFIDPTQIADKPEEFRTGAAVLLVEAVLLKAAHAVLAEARLFIEQAEPEGQPLLGPQHIQIQFHGVPPCGAGPR